VSSANSSLSREERQITLHFYYSILEENGVEKFMQNRLPQDKMLNCWDLRRKRGGES
jgi:hypothetical protein